MNLRPEDAARELGVSRSTFWRWAKLDPDFPALVRLSPRCTVVRSEDLQRFVAKKAAQPRAQLKEAA